MREKRKPSKLINELSASKDKKLLQAKIQALKDKKLLQAKIQALVVELLQVLDGQPLVHGLMALDTAKQIIRQEIETKSKMEDKTK